MKWTLALGGTGAALAMVLSAPAVIGQQRAIRTVSSISQQDKASGAKQHPELLTLPVSSIDR